MNKHDNELVKALRRCMECLDSELNGHGRELEAYRIGEMALADHDAREGERESYVDFDSHGMSVDMDAYLRTKDGREKFRAVAASGAAQPQPSAIGEPCSLAEALNVIENWAMCGNVLHDDDVLRFRAIADKFGAQLHKNESGTTENWPEALMIRDTKLYDDMGGCGQRIFTTAGAGYEKRKYIRADLAEQPSVADEIDWKHIANEWADEATNGPAYIQCLRDGTQTSEEIIQKMRANFARIRAPIRAATEHRGWVDGASFQCASVRATSFRA